MRHEFWGMFHDGIITKLAGSVPGDVTIYISIEYLRKQFHEPGIGFKINLRGCKVFSYQEFDEKAETNLDAIAIKNPEILRVDLTDDFVQIDCVMGTLTTSYESASVFLDTGTAITYEQLESACDAYWEDWAARNKKSS